MGVNGAVDDVHKEPKKPSSFRTNYKSSLSHVLLPCGTHDLASDFYYPRVSTSQGGSFPPLKRSKNLSVTSGGAVVAGRLAFRSECSFLNPYILLTNEKTATGHAGYDAISDII